MNYRLTNQNLILCLGGHQLPGHGRQRHLPIFADDKGVEYVSLNGLTLVPVSTVPQDEYTRRETVSRG